MKVASQISNMKQWRTLVPYLLEVEYPNEGSTPKYPYLPFSLTAPPSVKVVIIGQGPYPSGISDGLAFSCGEHKPAAELRTIYKEIGNNYPDLKVPTIWRQGQGDLSSWAEQGVLLLHSALTTQLGSIGAHRTLWKGVTDDVVKALNAFVQPIVWVLWGNDAKQKARYLNNSRHLVLTAAHPSPLSAYRGFFGCNHFFTANQYLQELGKKPINWESPFATP